MSDKNSPSVALISEFPPPSAGMTVLAEEYYMNFKNCDYPIIKIRTNPTLGMFNWIGNIRVIRSAVKWFVFLTSCSKIIQSDVIHIFSSSGLNFILFTIPPIFLARLFSKKIIIHYHGGAAKEFFSKYKWLLSFSLNRCHELVVPSEYLQLVFKEFGYSSKIIPNPVNIDRFTHRFRTEFKPIVISIRNLTSVYNVQCVVRSFAILKSKYPNAKLYIAGDGPEKNNIIQLIKELQLDSIEMLGNIRNDEVPKYLNEADIFINTSNVDNMPGSILEAFSSGLPVVSTNVGGIPYMIEHDKSGFLADANDHVSLGKYLIYIVENPKKTLEITESAYKYVSNLQWCNIKDKWLSIYKNI